jgi:hypothetical protein
MTPDPNGERYRIYRIDKTGSLGILATCADMDAAMVAIRTLTEEGEFSDGAVGLLDRPVGDDGFGDLPGVWLISPFSPVRR